MFSWRRSRSHSLALSVLCRTHYPYRLLEAANASAHPDAQTIDRQRLLPNVQASRIGAWAFSASLRHLPHQCIPQFQFGDSAAQCLRVIAIGIAAPDERREGGSAILRGVPVSRPQRGHAALTARLDQVVHRVDARARLSGGLPLLHAAKHKLDGFAPCFQRDGGLPHTPSITGVGHRSVFQTLSGRIAEALDHFSGRHRGREIWFHRPFSFLGTEHN